MEFFNCNKCDKVFGNKFDLYKHSVKLVFHCPICASRFSTCQDFEFHRKTEHFLCQKCKFVTIDKSWFEFHVLTECGFKSFLCQLCQNQFENKTETVAHICTVKTSENSVKLTFKCPKCVLEKASLEDLKNHWFSVHKPDQNVSKSTEIFNCDVCEFESTDMGLINSHKHDPNLSMACKFCSAEMKNLKSLELHFKRAHYTKFAKFTPLRCKTCNFETGDKIAFGLHETKFCTKQNCAKCDFCDMMFTISKNQIKHVEKFHPNQVKKTEKDLVQPPLIEPKVEPPEIDFTPEFTSEVLPKILETSTLSDRGKIALTLEITHARNRLNTFFS